MVRWCDCAGGAASGSTAVGASRGRSTSGNAAAASTNSGKSGRYLRAVRRELAQRSALEERERRWEGELRAEKESWASAYTVLRNSSARMFEMHGLEKAEESRRLVALRVRGRNIDRKYRFHQYESYLAAFNKEVRKQKATTVARQTEKNQKINEQQQLQSRRLARVEEATNIRRARIARHEEGRVWPVLPDSEEDPSCVEWVEMESVAADGKRTVVMKRKVPGMSSDEDGVRKIVRVREKSTPSLAAVALMAAKMYRDAWVLWLQEEDYVRFGVDPKDHESAVHKEFFSWLTAQSPSKAQNVFSSCSV